MSYMFAKVGAGHESGELDGRGGMAGGPLLRPRPPPPNNPSWAPILQELVLKVEGKFKVRCIFI